MRMARLVAVAVFVLAISFTAVGQSNAVFLNNDGTITASGGNDLTLTNSTLAGVSNLGLGYDCGSSGEATCSGTVSFTTGHTMEAGGHLTGNAMFSGGSTSSFTITSNMGPGGGFTFTGMFSNASWTMGMVSGCTPTSTDNCEFWTFVGTIADGTLTEKDGQTFTGISGVTITLTTIGGGPKVVKGFNTWTDAGGTTTIPSPVPEPGTLTLLGSSLVGLALCARRLSLKRGSAS